MSFEVDIVCVGFGPATAGFLTTLSRAQLPLQVTCYERADDIGFGVSGVATRARGIRASWPDLDIAQIPMAAPITREKLVCLRGERAFELPYIPPFLRKHDGFVLSLGQFLQFAGGELMGGGAVQIWPASPVECALIEDRRVCGVRVGDMDIRAALTVVGDGPVGAVGRQLDREFGLPPGHHQREWAVGMKMVADLPDGADLEPGTVIHTFGYPEPEIFGFLYVHPGRMASVGIFVPSWFRNPMRTSYRYLQHYILHPYLWRYLRGAKLRSWGAKSLQESGRRGEPFLAGEGWARIGEGSGSTNVLTGSGVDEAWTTGVQLAEAVIELHRAGQSFTAASLQDAYVARRRQSWIEREGRIAERARDGFHHGVLPGLLGMTLAGFTRGKVFVPGRPRPMPAVDRYYDGRIPAEEVDRIVADCRTRGVPCHDALMDRCGWPAIPYDGQLLVSHQDALLVGGKVQAPPGVPDHVRFVSAELCERCAAKLCIEMCSGQAIAPGPGGVPAFDREKCVHCGACLWNCAEGNIEFAAAAGGLHSSEN